MLGGAALVEQSAGGATVNSGALFGVAVRYVHSVPLTDFRLRPFAEVGAWARQTSRCISAAAMPMAGVRRRVARYGRRW